MDLTGPGNTGPTSGPKQTVLTIAGQRCHLSFWLGNAQSRATAFYNLPSPPLTFRNATAPADSQTGLDDVSLLAAVPEPGTWLLMLAGIGAFWLGRGGGPAARRPAGLPEPTSQPGLGEFDERARAGRPASMSACNT